MLEHCGQHEVDDNAGNVVLSLAGGQNSSDGVCYGQTCSIPTFSDSHNDFYGTGGANLAAYTTKYGFLLPLLQDHMALQTMLYLHINPLLTKMR